MLSSSNRPFWYFDPNNPYLIHTIPEVVQIQKLLSKAYNRSIWCWQQLEVYFVINLTLIQNSSECTNPLERQEIKKWETIKNLSEYHVWLYFNSKWTLYKGLGGSSIGWKVLSTLTYMWFVVAHYLFTEWKNGIAYDTKLRIHPVVFVNESLPAWSLQCINSRYWFEIMVINVIELLHRKLAIDF